MSPRLTPIRLALYRRDRSQKWLAGQLGMSESALSRIVNGLVPPEPTRERIAALLDVPVETLFALYDPSVDPSGERAA